MPNDHRVGIYLQPANEIATIAGYSIEEEVLEVSEGDKQDMVLEPGSQVEYLSPKTPPGREREVKS